MIEILDKRVAYLISRRYTKLLVSHKDLLPKEYNGNEISSYIFERAPRPRDIIDFFNKCILAGTGLSKLNKKEFALAEGEYSRSRLKALGDEWSADYPDLLDYTKIIQKMPASFTIKTLDPDKIGSICLDFVTQELDKKTLIHLMAKKFVEGHINFEEFINIIIQLFYKTGLVGLKLGASETTSWSDEKGRSVSQAEIGEETSVVVHPTYQRALGILLGKSS